MVRFLIHTAVISFLLAQHASCETFHLRSGGRLEGKLLNRNEAPRRTYRIKLDKGGDLTLEARDVIKVVVATREQQQYRETLEKMPDTTDAHMKMYELCKELSLSRERKFHLEQVLRIDPSHQTARSLLKYRRKPDGSWAKIEEIKQDQGLVRLGGKWVTQEEAHMAELAKQREAQQIRWKKDIKRWRSWLGDRRRRSKALASFNAIDDPLAVDPLVKMFHSDSNAAVREMLAEILGRIGTGSAARALAEAAMQGGTEDENELRLFCIRQLEKNNLRAIAPSFVSELRSSSNVRVRRAAYALGVLGGEAAVLPLIKAVRTKHTKLVGGRGNGGITASTNGSFSVGKTKPRKVDDWRDNKEVRDALGKLTDAPNFGYNQRRWLDWYQKQNAPPKQDLRRDP